jgi:hypothetical protein
MQDNASGEMDRYPYHRQYVRYRVRLKVEVHVSESYPSWTHNISSNGICFEIPRQLPVGREVVLWVYVPEAAEPIHSRCRIVWHDRADEGHKHGGQFLFFTGDGMARLEGFLNSLSPGTERAEMIQ